MITFSIIIPVYNCKNYLPMCISRIRAQTYPGYEIILVDDGSTDGSGQLCDSLAAENASTHVFHKPNGGASSARNMGMEYANGRYLLFVDSDDTLEPDCLETVLAAMQSGTDELTVYGMAFDFYSGETLRKTECLAHPCSELLN